MKIDWGKYVDITLSSFPFESIFIVDGMICLKTHYVGEFTAVELLTGEPKAIALSSLVTPCPNAVLVLNR